MIVQSRVCAAFAVPGAKLLAQRKPWSASLRHGRSATVITSQLPLGKWHEWVADPTHADAILDRIVHDAYELDLKGPSRRKEKPCQT